MTKFLTTKTIIVSALFLAIATSCSDFPELNEEKSTENKSDESENPNTDPDQSTTAVISEGLPPTCTAEEEKTYTFNQADKKFYSCENGEWVAVETKNDDLDGSETDGTDTNDEQDPGIAKPGSNSDANPSLALVESVAPGDQCAFGGQRFVTGDDKDKDGKLTDSEILSVEFRCANRPESTVANLGLYVDADKGLSTGLCTYEKPCKTITRAVNLVPRNVAHIVQILVSPGVYKESVVLDKFTVAEGASLLITGRDKDSVIDGAGVRSFGIRITSTQSPQKALEPTGKGLQITGFRIKRAKVFGIDIVDSKNVFLGDILIEQNGTDSKDVVEGGLRAYRSEVRSLKYVNGAGEELTKLRDIVSINNKGSGFLFSDSISEFSRLEATGNEIGFQIQNNSVMKSKLDVISGNDIGVRLQSAVLEATEATTMWSNKKAYDFLTGSVVKNQQLLKFPCDSRASIKCEEPSTPLALSCTGNVARRSPGSFDPSPYFTVQGTSSCDIIKKMTETLCNAGYETFGPIPGLEDNSETTSKMHIQSSGTCSL